MGYRLKPDLQYLMPTHFGPAAGPRQSPDGGRWTLPDQRLKESYALTLEGDRAQLEQLLPQPFVLEDPPRLTVTFSYQTNIGWLAGRGYDMLGVAIPARYDDGVTRARGPFLLVLWENLTEPIITGREQLGYSKIFCDLPPPARAGGDVKCSAAWMGHTFLELEAGAFEPAAGVDGPRTTEAVSEGILHLAYLPRIGRLTEAAVIQPVITPVESTLESVLERRTGSGGLRILPTSWQDMPTQHRIVEALRALKLSASGPVLYRRVRGSGDLLEVHPLAADGGRK